MKMMLKVKIITLDDLELWSDDHNTNDSFENNIHDHSNVMTKQANEYRGCRSV